MGNPTKRPRWIPWLLGACIVAGVGLIWLLNQRSGSRTAASPQDAFPLPPYSESPHLNTGPEARYVGIDACAECHRGNHSSYLLTAHSKALNDLNPKAEPPDGSFYHQPSGRTYRVYRQGDQFRHEEVLRTAEGTVVARMDLPIRYLVGSGNFSRSYLVEVDGFLHESPITWYTSKQKWDMSPGYDYAGHSSFERPINLTCLACHAGRVEPAGEAVHRMIFHEKAIGCESCHGPGSLHVDFHRAKRQIPGEDDLTIVNPGKLSRDRLEAVCAACHLSAEAMVALRGRRIHDFRPGRLLTDYCVHYRLNVGGEQMTVVGHIEQLRLSPCYQKSGDMTCLTCHNPHAKERPKDLTAFYRQKCLDCHESKPCGLALAERLKKEPADDCSACHMPRGDTDIPHIAFTHHRIGLHKSRPPSHSEKLPELVPVDEIPNLSPIDQKRNLGWAYVLVADNPQHGKYAETFRERGRELLEAVDAAGLRDGVTFEGLAKVYWKKDPARAGRYAQEALDAQDLPAEGRAVALVIRADCYQQEGKTEEAIRLLEELVTIRRQAEDWRLLGRLYLEIGQPEKALEALKKALAIRPYRHDIHGALAEAYRRLGDNTLARAHQAKAQWLLQNRQE